MRSRRAAVKAQRRTFMLGLMVLTVIVIGSVLLGTIRTQAAPAEPSYKYYTSIQIRREIPSGISQMNISQTITTAWTNIWRRSVRSITSCRGTFIPDSI